MLATKDAILRSEWSPPEITSKHKPHRIVVTQSGWRSAPDVFIEPDAKRVAKVYKLLAGNERIAFTCGYHWRVQFDYRDAPSESILINEECESFRFDQKETWAALESLFADARKRPTHFAITVTAADETQVDALRSALEPHFGTILTIEGATLTLAQRRAWTPRDVARLRAASPLIAKVEPIEVVRYQ